MSTPPARIADPGSGLPADHVLETLRAQPAIQRVPNPKLTLFASRGFLDPETRSEEHTSELQSLMRISYAVFCLTNKNITISAYTASQCLPLMSDDSPQYC